MASPLAWTIQVAVNSARRIERRKLLAARLLHRGAGERSLPGPARELWSVVNELPDRQRQAIALKYLADLLDEDIARLLGISRSTVSSALTDGRRRLRTRLKTSELENR